MGADASVNALSCRAEWHRPPHTRVGSQGVSFRGILPHRDRGGRLYSCLELSHHEGVAQSISFHPSRTVQPYLLLCPWVGLAAIIQPCPALPCLSCTCPPFSPETAAENTTLNSSHTCLSPPHGIHSSFCPSKPQPLVLSAGFLRLKQGLQSKARCLAVPHTKGECLFYI